MLQAIQGLYGSATVAVKINGRQGLPLVSVSGVRQGCPLSPTLFGLLADGLHRFLQAAAAVDGLAIGPDMMVTELGYADDFCLVSATADGLQRISDIAALWCDAVGMLPSSDKTVVMEMTGRQSADGSWSSGGRALRQVSEVQYLGAIFQSGQGFLPSLARLQHWAQAAWAQLSRQYGTLHCEKGVWLMLQLYGACVLPAGSFACELWGGAGSAAIGRHVVVAGCWVLELAHDRLCLPQGYGSGCCAAHASNRRQGLGSWPFSCVANSWLRFPAAAASAH